MFSSELILKQLTLCGVEFYYANLKQLYYM